MSTLAHLSVYCVLCCAVRCASRPSTATDALLYKVQIPHYRLQILLLSGYFCSQAYFRLKIPVTSASQVYFRYWHFRFTGTLPIAETSKTSAPDTVTSASHRYNYYVSVTPLHIVIR